jgi:TonB-linked SusC/RagA family outer membrane protein
MIKNRFAAFVKAAMRVIGMPMLLAILFSSTTFARFINEQDVLNKIVSINLEKAEIKKVLAEIKEQSGVEFVYSSKVIQSDKRISINARQKRLREILDEVLTPLNIQYKVINDQIVLYRLPTLIEQSIISSVLISEPDADRVIRGRVVNSTGEPLSGVSIIIKGTQFGATTGNNGEYSITIPDANVVLVFSYVGYTPQEVVIGNKTTVNISLIATGANLSEVVVIGYGAANRRDLTGSITTVKGKEIADKPNNNPVASLQGKVAGLTVVNSGRPGQEPDIRIRGTNTINGVKPLYVVDGILNDNINFLNPADIESMEILKDPSSLAIFGVRGANGVIIINTKKARAGQLLVNVNSSVGIKRVTDRIGLTNAADFKTLLDEQLKNQGSAPFNYANWQANTNWQDQIFQDAVMNNNNVSITGATEKNRFYMGLGYSTEEGLIKHEKLTKFTLNLNDEFLVSKALKFGFTFNGYRAHLPTNKDVGSAIKAAPIAPVYNMEYGLYHTLPEFQRAQVYNPMDNIELRADNTRNFEYRGVGSIYGEVIFLKDFTFKTAFYADYGFNDGRSYGAMIRFYNPENPYKIDTVQRLTSVAEYHNKYTKLQSDYLLTYKKRIGDHNITALAGATTNYASYDGTSASINQGVNQIPNNPRFWYANADMGDPSTLRGSGSGWEKATLSYLVRGLYNYNNRYLLNASFRRDGSSAFPDNGGRWQNFAAIGAGWVISQEGFMKDQEIVDYLKVKGSVGKLGNQDPSRDYPYFSQLTSGNSGVFGMPNAVIQALEPAFFVDSAVHWETVKAWEAGVELNTFRNRLHFEANYYRKKTEDILIAIPAAATAGNKGEVRNAGDVTNRGYEFLATWNDKINKDWSYSVSGNLTTIKNKVLNLYKKGYEIVGDPSRTTPGYPIGYFYGYISDGIYQTQEEIIKSNPTANDVKPGDIKFRDVNGDGTVNEQDRTMIGNPTPDFTYGVSFNVSYKNFDLSIDGQGVYGNEIFRNWESRTAFAIFNYPAYKLDRWHGVGTSNWEPILNPTRANNLLSSTYYIEDGSYFRLRNIQLGYNLNSNLLEKAHIRSLRVFVNAQNLKTWKNNTGYTPEFGGSSTSFGVDNGSYPLPAVYTFGLNLNF